MSYFPTFESTTQKPFLPHCLSLTRYLRYIQYIICCSAVAANCLFSYIAMQFWFLTLLQEESVSNFIQRKKKTIHFLGRCKRFGWIGKNFFSLNINETTISCAVYEHRCCYYDSKNRSSGIAWVEKGELESQ